MSVRTHLAATALAGLVVTAAVGSVGPPAQASGGDDDRVVRAGACSGPGVARWTMKAKSDDGRIEVEGEVDSNRVGQTWAWTIRSQGSVVARGTARTAGRSGSFSIERKVRDVAGQDALAFTAVRTAGGTQETCAGRISF